MNARRYIALCVALGALVGSFVYLALNGERQPQDKPTSDRPQAGDRSTNDERRRANDEQRRADDERRTTNDEQRTAKTERRTTNNEDRTTNHEQRTTNNEDGTTNNEEPWTDPTNARVLGSRNWIAPVSEEEEARISKVFEKARAARFDPNLSNQGRATSIEVARTVINACFEALEARQPAASGRLIVAWTSGANDGRGWIRDPRISVNYKLGEPAFEGCVLDGLVGRTFPAVDGDPIEVEAPFFFDGAF